MQNERLPRGYYIGGDWDQPSVTADMIVDDREPGPHFTGVLDAAGNRIYRKPERVMFGFTVKA